MEQVVIKLPENVDIAQAFAVHGQFMQNHDAEGMVVDASEARRASTSAIQVIIAAARFFKKENRAFSVTNTVEEFVKCFAVLGLEDEIKSMILNVGHR